MPAIRYWRTTGKIYVLRVNNSFLVKDLPRFLNYYATLIHANSFIKYMLIFLSAKIRLRIVISCNRYILQISRDKIIMCKDIFKCNFVCHFIYKVILQSHFIIIIIRSIFYKIPMIINNNYNNISFFSWFFAVLSDI